LDEKKEEAPEVKEDTPAEPTPRKRRKAEPEQNKAITPPKENK
jgi:hypothetical protein